jgi:hypothetical protein
MTTNGETSRRGNRLLRWLAVLVLGVALLHLLWAPVYRYPPAEPFSGPHWYNPYEDFVAPGLKANFHAHAKAWGGLLYGALTGPEVQSLYKDLGYEIACISNYQSVAASTGLMPLHVPAYEHGIGIGQQHQTVLGSPLALWFDYPIYQGVAEKQHVLNLLAERSKAVILNHPNKGVGYQIEDMAKLTGYTAIELCSRFAEGIPFWDAALSAGRPVWGVCTDDGHDQTRAGHLRMGWVMIGSAKTVPDVFEALRTGCFYSAYAPYHKDPCQLLSCELKEGKVIVRVDEPSAIRFYSQGGKQRTRRRDGTEAVYELQEDDTYLRIEVKYLANMLYLNPLIRHDGDPLLPPTATVRTGWTLARRLFAVTLLVLAARWLLRSSRRPTAASA